MRRASLTSALGVGGGGPFFSAPVPLSQNELMGGTPRAARSSFTRCV
jgi:hypothetical protein